MGSPIITLTTDFGLSDHYVGVMKGVIASINPAVTTMDITHDVRPYCVAQGAFFIAQAYRYFPAGTIHMVVVDPGVGTQRRAIVAKVGQHLFVAPDNGVLSQVFERDAQCTSSISGTATEDRSPRARVVDVKRHALQPLSNTFHGRDVFAPTSARLSAGLRFEEIGPEIKDYVTLPATKPIETKPGRWRGRILNIDRFGNLVTSFEPRHLRDSSDFRLVVGNLQLQRIAQNYADLPAGEPSLIAGSSGFLEVSINQMSAADQAGATIGSAVDLFGPQL